MSISITSATEIGAAIRRTRKKAHLTQSAAAGLCGVSLPFFNAIENGKGTAQINKVLHVCQKLGITISVTEPEGG